MSNQNVAPWTILDIIKWATNYFNEKGIESPRLHIELILSHILNLPRIDLYRFFDKPLNNDELNRIKLFIRRRISKEPIQYIIGKINFLGKNFFIDNSSLIPRPETELMTKLCINEIKDKSLKILDIGTGCGCIAISLAINSPLSHITAIDISEQTLELASKNALEHKIKNINFEKVDILNNTPSENNFDIIISNPPYISAQEYFHLEPELLFEPKHALTDEADGLLFYRRFSELFPTILSHKGKFFLEIGYGQFPLIKKIFSESNYFLFSMKDFNGITRVVSNINLSVL